MSLPHAPIQIYGAALGPVDRDAAQSELRSHRADGDAEALGNSRRRQSLSVEHQ